MRLTIMQWQRNNASGTVLWINWLQDRERTRASEPAPTFCSGSVLRPSEWRRRPVSRVLSPARGPGDGHSSGTRVATGLARPTRTTGPETGLRRHTLAGDRRRRPYLVLLPVGFAVPPTLPPARCALTAPFHPYPQAGRSRPRRAVCSLWHFPWGRPRRALPGTVFPWSPDFPPPPEGGSGHPAACSRPLGSRRRRGRASAATASARPMVSASSAPSQRVGPPASLKRAQGQRERHALRHRRDSRSGPAPPSPPAASGRHRHGRRRGQAQPRPRQRRPVEQLAGILLAGGRDVAVADHAVRRDRASAAPAPSASSSNAAICALGERAIAPFVARVDELDAERDVVERRLGPATSSRRHAMRAARPGTSATTVPSSSIR